MAKKLERPLVIGGNEAYPLTTADQIIMSDGSRLESDESLFSKIVDVIYPIGSIYMSVNEASPSVLFGGTWERIKDTFLLSAGDTYSAGATGGEAEHTLTVDEIPSHSHGFVNAFTNRTISTEGNFDIPITKGSSASDMSLVKPTQVTGGSQPHNNMPPYLAVYCWKRVS